MKIAKGVSMPESFMFDNTKLQAYACKMRGKLAMEEHLVPVEGQEALAFGIGFHKAVELWTQAQLDGKAESEAFELGLEGFKGAWEKELSEEQRGMLEMGGSRRSWANFQVLFKQYTMTFPLSMFEGILAVETPFTLFLGRTPKGREISWSGVLDRVVKWQGGVYYTDLKTSTYALDDRFFNKFRMSSQLRGYVWAGHELGVADFDGAMVQGVEVQVPQHGVKLKKDGTPYARQGRTADKMCAMDVIPIDEWAVEEWKVSTLAKIDEIIDAREAGCWPMAMGELCEGFGGRGCTYRKLCTLPPELREAEKAKWFRQREWNPLERD